MKSFGELLSEYMTRTGISDSEMARHLGVSRQTIFRWKEGMTARPRVREDVLKCAERLRLTAEERDALLLAAGFAPETRQTTSDERSVRLQTQTTNETQTLVPIVEPSAIVVAPTRSQPRRARWLALLIPVMALVGLFGGALYIFPRETQNLVALVYPPTETPTPTPRPPTPIPPPLEQIIVIATLNSRGGAAPPYNVTARLRFAFEQEIQKQNFAAARLMDIADQVREPTMAERLRARSGAQVMLWGNYSGDNARVEIGYETVVPVNQSGASVFPILPRDQSTTLNLSKPNELRALALLTLMPLHLERGETAHAVEAFNTAQSMTPYSNEMRAALEFYRGYLLQTTGLQQSTTPRDLDEALRAYNRNLNTTSLYEAHLNRGLVYLAQNEDAAAKADFQRAQGIEDGRPEAWRAACWAFALEQQPQAALPLCDAATTRDASAWSLDTRAIVYAELGRYADAANEFENFLRWLETQPPRTREIFSPTRRAWIKTLRAGKNPFDTETLNTLRDHN